MHDKDVGDILGDMVNIAVPFKYSMSTTMHVLEIVMYALVWMLIKPMLWREDANGLRGNEIAILDEKLSEASGIVRK